jgi:hypothetical protein
LGAHERAALRRGALIYRSFGRAAASRRFVSAAARAARIHSVPIHPPCHSPYPTKPTAKAAYRAPTSPARGRAPVADRRHQENERPRDPPRRRPDRGPATTAERRCAGVTVSARRPGRIRYQSRKSKFLPYCFGQKTLSFHSNRSDGTDDGSGHLVLVVAADRNSKREAQRLDLVLEH